ncbi:MAG TPA: c-type cytochrome [Vicinamibacterales bacterium]|nr:c-type cytochrome [Vicinamibacterales bacterium]
MTCRGRNAGLSVVIGVLTWGVAACQDRAAQRPLPHGAQPPETVQQVPLVPGMPPVKRPAAPPHEGNAHTRAEGRRLYAWMNCSGCHFEGGGGIGPPLMDTDWIYGGEPAQIFDSIASGRANGMPAYGEKLAAHQIWLIVEHVQSLSEAAGAQAPSGQRAGGGQ